MGIYKEKEIIQAYSGFRRLGIRDLLFGDIINWTPGQTVWWPPTKWAEAAAQRGIIAFQRWKYPNSPWIYSTHSIIHLMNGVCWNVTAPRADYLKLEERRLNPDRVYIVCRYRDFRIETAADRNIIYSGIELLQGSAYDARQLLAILIQEYLGFPEEKYYHVLDPRRKTVCSPAVRGLWVKLWLEKGGDSDGLGGATRREDAAGADGESWNLRNCGGIGGGIAITVVIFAEVSHLNKAI